jgi:hypothetical protein
MKINVLKFLALGLLAAGAAMAAAQQAPEINPGSATIPFALLGGAVMIVRSRIRR